MTAACIRLRGRGRGAAAGGGGKGGGGLWSTHSLCLLVSSPRSHTIRLCFLRLKVRFMPVEGAGSAGGITLVTERNQLSLWDVRASERRCAPVCSVCALLRACVATCVRGGNEAQALPRFPWCASFRVAVTGAAPPSPPPPPTSNTVVALVDTSTLAAGCTLLLRTVTRWVWLGTAPWWICTMPVTGGCEGGKWPLHYSLTL